MKTRHCPNCDTLIHTSDQSADGVVQCSKCGQRFRIRSKGKAEQGNSPTNVESKPSSLRELPIKTPEPSRGRLVPRHNDAQHNWFEDDKHVGDESSPSESNRYLKWGLAAVLAFICVVGLLLAVLVVPYGGKNSGQQIPKQQHVAGSDSNIAGPKADDTTPNSPLNSQADSANEVVVIDKPIGAEPEKTSKNPLDEWLVATDRPNDYQFQITPRQLPEIKIDRPGGRDSLVGASFSEEQKMIAEFGKKLALDGQATERLWSGVPDDFSIQTLDFVVRFAAMNQPIIAIRRANSRLGAQGLSPKKEVDLTKFRKSVHTTLPFTKEQLEAPTELVTINLRDNKEIATFPVEAQNPSRLFARVRPDGKQLIVQEVDIRNFRLRGYAIIDAGNFKTYQHFKPTETTVWIDYVSNHEIALLQRKPEAKHFNLVFYDLDARKTITELLLDEVEQLPNALRAEGYELAEDGKWYCMHQLSACTTADQKYLIIPGKRQLCFISIASRSVVGTIPLSKEPADDVVLSTQNGDQQVLVAAIYPKSPPRALRIDFATGKVDSYSFTGEQLHGGHVKRVSNGPVADTLSVAGRFFQYPVSRIPFDYRAKAVRTTLLSFGKRELTLQRFDHAPEQVISWKPAYKQESIDYITEQLSRNAVYDREPTKKVVQKTPTVVNLNRGNGWRAGLISSRPLPPILPASDLEIMPFPQAHNLERGIALFVHPRFLPKENLILSNHDNKFDSAVRAVFIDLKSRRCDNEIKLYDDVITDRYLGPRPKEFLYPMVLALSPDGKVVATQDPMYMGRVDLTDDHGKRLASVQLHEGKAPIDWLGFIDQNRLAEVSNGKLTAWDTTTWEPLYQAAGDYQNVVCHRMENQVIAVARGGEIDILDLAKGELITRLKPTLPGGEFSMISLSPDGQQLAAARCLKSRHSFRSDYDDHVILSVFELATGKEARMYRCPLPTSFSWLTGQHIMTFGQKRTTLFDVRFPIPLGNGHTPIIGAQRREAFSLFGDRTMVRQLPDGSLWVGDVQNAKHKEQPKFISSSNRVRLDSADMKKLLDPNNKPIDLKGTPIRVLASIGTANDSKLLAERIAKKLEGQGFQIGKGGYTLKLERLIHGATTQLSNDKGKTLSVPAMSVSIGLYDQKDKLIWSTQNQAYNFDQLDKSRYLKSTRKNGNVIIRRYEFPNDPRQAVLAELSEAAAQKVDVEIPHAVLSTQDGQGASKALPYLLSDLISGHY